MKRKIPELKLAMDGFLTTEQAEKAKVIRQHYKDLKSRKADLETTILSLAESYNAELYKKSDVLPVNREITVELGNKHYWQ